MGEVFQKTAEWVKEHKALAIAISAGILLLVYLWRSSQRAAQAQGSAVQVAAGPSDALISAQTQAQAALQQEQIAAQAQGVQYGYQAQVQLAAIELQAEANNAQNQAALTLGLAQAGNSTQSILELLAAQPGVVPTSSTIGNSTTSPATGAILTGAIPTGGGGINTHLNPAPVQPLPPPRTPVGAVLARDPSQPTPNYTDPWAQIPVDWQALGQQDFSWVWAGDTGSGSEVPPMTAQGVQPNFVPPTFYDLPSALGAQSIVSPSTVPGSGGPFYNAPAGDVLHPLDAGGVMNQIHNASPTARTSILASYGIQNTAGVQSAISHALGANEPITATGVS